jgi:hypothetical protein
MLRQLDDLTTLFPLEVPRGARADRCFEDEEIEFIRSRQWAEGKASKRAAEIVTAFDRWRPKRGARAKALRIDEYHNETGAVTKLEERVRDIQNKIEKMPQPQTVEGIAVKMRCALLQFDFGLDQQYELLDLAEQFMRVMGTEPPVRVFFP